MEESVQVRIWDDNIPDHPRERHGGSSREKGLARILFLKKPRKESFG
jgi:hypothetical protein